MNDSVNVIDQILWQKGYAVSFQQKTQGAVVCTAARDSDTLEVLARSVPEGSAELARRLGMQQMGWRLAR